MSLRSYKKNELKEMCQKLNLDEDGLKVDLEDRLQDYLDARDLSIEDVPELQDHFIDLPVSPSTARKAARKSMAMITGDEEDFDLSGKTSEMLRPLSKRLSRAAEDVKSHDFEVSPSKVAQWANDKKAQYFDPKRLSKATTKSISSFVGDVRKQMSQVSTIAALSVIVEGAFMTKALVPISWEVKLGGLRSITVPDILVFLSVNEYWKPILTWMSFQLIPFFLATIFNMRASSTSAGSRKTSSGPVYDPVTYAIAKLLMVYLAFSTSLGSSFVPKELALVQRIVGGETFFIGTAITLVYSLYEAIL